MTNILITGGLGFIGSHISITLLKENNNLTIIDSFTNSDPIVENRIKRIFSKKNIDISNRFKVIRGDIRNFNLLKKIFSDAKEEEKPINYVIHLAGKKSIFESKEEPIDYWSNNVSGSINLLNVMEKFNCRNIVFSSSATIYGESQKMPLKENYDIKPISTYGQTKSTVENILKDIYDKSPGQWRIAILRYFNPAGAHSSGLIGEQPCGKPNNLFPFLTQVALGLREELNIYGKDWDTPDGTGIRDYIHIMDLAEGHKSALDALLIGEPQLLTLNLGTGLGTSVFEFIKTFEKINKVKIKYKICDRREGDIGILIADNKLALEKLNWQPKKNLDDICRDGWQWQLKNSLSYY